MNGASPFAAGLAFCLTAAAWCPAVIADDEKAAKIAFKKATDLYDELQFAEAADAFREAYRLKPSWKILYNIGQSEAAAKRHGLSLEAFERYLSEGGDDIDTKRQREVQQEIKRLRDIVGSLDFYVPDGAVVSVDGIDRGIAPLAGHVLVAAGVDHRVAATLGGEVIIDRIARVAGGQVMIIEARKDAEPESPVAAEEPAKEAGAGPVTSTETGSPLRTAGWIALGIGAAALVGGAVTGGMALSADNDLEESCAGFSCPSSVDPDIEKKRDSLALATDILLPAGGVIAATGVVLLIVDAAKGGDEGEGGDRAMRVRPIFARDGGGLLIERRF